MIKAVRVFYRDDKVVWTHSLEGTGEFPTTIEQDLSEIPDKPQLDDNGSAILDADENFIKLGGVPEDYGCIEVNDTVQAQAVVDAKRNENKVIDKKLIIGSKRIPAKPPLNHSAHIAKVIAINPTAVKPITVRREYAGFEYDYSCYVTEAIKTSFLEGKLNIGDLIRCEYFDEQQDWLITCKIYKNW